MALAKSKRLAHARHIIKELRGLTDRVILMCSGGKDSLASLALLRERFDGDQIVAVYLYLAPGLRCVEANVEAACSTLGVRELLKLPHPDGIWALQEALYQPPRFQALAEAPVIKHRDVAEVLRSRAGTRWIVSGERKMDSPHRRGMISCWGELDVQHGKCYPLSEWSDSEVESWLSVYRPRLHIARRLGGRTRSTGVGLDHRVLREIHERYPDDWRRLCAVYPELPAVLYAPTHQ